MTLSIICTNKDPMPWKLALESADPSIDVQVWPHEKDCSAVEYGLFWQYPEGQLQQYLNLKCVSSMGAGVDHLLSDPHYPQQLPLVRLVDPQLAQSMFEYICTAVMFKFRAFEQYQIQQQTKTWSQLPASCIGDTSIGVLGLGELGGYVAKKLSNMGFNTLGWARSAKTLKGINSFHGHSQLNSFLTQCDMLICLLPLTDATKGILNKSLFEQLPQGAYVINVARGEHLKQNDLIEALDSGHLSGACLDVFVEEPLNAEHPFWLHPKIKVTPHCSSMTHPESVAPQIVENYHRMRNKQPLLNLVDLQKGY